MLARVGFLLTLNDGQSQTSADSILQPVRLLLTPYDDHAESGFCWPYLMTRVRILVVLCGKQGQTFADPIWSPESDFCWLSLPESESCWLILMTNRQIFANPIRGSESDFWWQQHDDQNQTAVTCWPSMLSLYRVRLYCTVQYQYITVGAWISAVL